MIDPGAQRVAGRAPKRPSDRIPLVENANRSRKKRKTIDKITSSIDWVDGPNHVVLSPGVRADFLANNIMGRKALGETAANQFLNPLIDF